MLDASAASLDDAAMVNGRQSLPAASPGRLQRAQGAIRIGFRQREGATRLYRLFQEGSAKVRLPHAFGAIPEAVLINTAGGLAGGDRFETEIALAPGAHAVLTTQACERVYRSGGGDAHLATRATVAEGARLDWLPQETILFDGGRIRRSLDVDLEADASLLAVESLIVGRAAHGEVVRSGLFRDRWRIRQAGRLIHAEDLRLEGDIAATLDRPALGAGARAVASVLAVLPNCEALVEAARNLIGPLGGASAWNGKLVCRLAAPDGFSLRRALLPLLVLLSGGRPLPRVWQL